MLSSNSRTENIFPIRNIFVRVQTGNASALFCGANATVCLSGCAIFNTVQCAYLPALLNEAAVTKAGRISFGTAFILSSAFCTSGRITT